MSDVHVVADATFEAEVLKAKGSVVVDFWAGWCAPCVAFAPHFAEFAKQTPGVKFCKLNVDESSVTAKAQGIRAIPTVLYFKDGVLVKSVTGATEASMLLRSLRPGK